MSKPIIRLGFDARLAGAAHAGIGRYSEELLRELLAISPSNILWVVFVSKPDQLPWIKKHPQVELRTSNVRHYGWQEQVVWLWQLLSADLDLLHVPHFNVPIGYLRPFVVTIHDLLWHTQKDPRATTLSPWQYRIKYWGYRLVSRLAMKRAQIIFVPTQFVKQQIKQLVGKTAPIIVTSEGLGLSFKNFESVGKKKRASKKKERAPYVVYTGSLYPHKNVGVVLRALAKLPTVHLKVITARGVFLQTFQEEVNRLGLAKQVEIFHQLSDEKVINIYLSAVALIQPSLAEGFGLTGIEAMAVGCPVIASDIPVLREVYQDKASFFPANDASVLQKIIERMLDQPLNQTEKQKMIEFGNSFSWEQAAAKTWDGLSSILKL